MYILCCNLILLTFVLTNCGLKHEPLVTPQNKEKERQTAIQNYLRKELEKDSAVYESIAFANPQMIKPMSFIKLDSMYAQKYALELKNKFDQDLEKQIQIQRQIVLNDTNPILHIETHLFGLRQKNKMTIYKSVVECEANSAIKQINTDDGLHIRSEDLPYYKRYLFEESIINPGYEPLSTEFAYYELWKAHEDSLSKEKQEKFLTHVFGLMRIIEKEKTTKTLTILQKYVRQHLDQMDSTEKINLDFLKVEEKFKKIEGLEKIEGYLVELTYKTIKNNLSYTSNFQFQLDPYMQILSFGQF